MPTEKLAMRHVRDVMRLKAAGMPSREIARRVGSAPSTERLTIRRFELSGLAWSLPDDIRAAYAHTMETAYAVRQLLAKALEPAISPLFLARELLREPRRVRSKPFQLLQVANSSFQGLLSPGWFSSVPTPRRSTRTGI
jgi:IS30 family transposase